MIVPFVACGPDCRALLPITDTADGREHQDCPCAHTFETRVRHADDSTIGREHYVLICGDCDAVLRDANEDELSDAAEAYAQHRYDVYYENPRGVYA